MGDEGGRAVHDGRPDEFDHGRRVHVGDGCVSGLAVADGVVVGCAVAELDRRGERVKPARVGHVPVMRTPVFSVVGRRRKRQRDGGRNVLDRGHSRLPSN